MRALPSTPRQDASGRPLADSFPRAFLIAAALMVGLSLVSVAAVRVTGNGPDQLRAAGQETVTAQTQRPLRFEDRPDGSIAVVDAQSGRVVSQFHGEQGFVRGALRALARERKARGLGPEQPFELIRRPDGSLLLRDPVSGGQIDLGSFGPSHVEAFATLMTATPRP